ncbi:hypothetical protein AVEN_122036-1, partial [Araneus ventricosus]
CKFGADTFSRIAEISVPESVDYVEMAITQDSDDELRSILEICSGLELKQLSLPSSEHLPKAVGRSIRTINKTVAASDIWLLPNLWEQVVRNAGDYIEEI